MLKKSKYPDSLIDTHCKNTYDKSMTKSYFSAAELFDALDARVKPFGRVSMLSIEEKTKISRYLLTKLKKGIGERLTNQQVDALYAYAQSVGVKIPHDKIVKIVIVTESTQP